MNKFWILGTGNWSDTVHWSLESGGEEGADVPTSEDDVFIDANSGFGGGGTITLGGEEAGYCNNFTANSGHSYTITGNISCIACYGSLTLESGFVSDSNVMIFLCATENGKTITINNATIEGQIVIMGTGSWVLQDNLITTDEFYQENGTFDANNHNVTANDFYFYADIGYTPTVIMGFGKWTPDRSEWVLDENNGVKVTIIPLTSPFPTHFRT